MEPYGVICICHISSKCEKKVRNNVWKRKNPIRGLEMVEKKVTNDVTISLKCLAYYYQNPNINFKTYKTNHYYRC